jgi:hypothetical protein
MERDRECCCSGQRWRPGISVWWPCYIGATCPSLPRVTSISLYTHPFQVRPCTNVTNVASLPLRLSSVAGRFRFKSGFIFLFSPMCDRGVGMSSSLQHPRLVPTAVIPMRFDDCFPSVFRFLTSLFLELLCLKFGNGTTCCFLKYIYNSFIVAILTKQCLLENHLSCPLLFKCLLLKRFSNKSSNRNHPSVWNSLSFLHLRSR